MLWGGLNETMGVKLLAQCQMKVAIMLVLPRVERGVSLRDKGTKIVDIYGTRWASPLEDTLSPSPEYLAAISG